MIPITLAASDSMRNIKENAHFSTMEPEIIKFILVAIAFVVAWLIAKTGLSSKNPAAKYFMISALAAEMLVIIGVVHVILPIVG